MIKKFIIYIIIILYQTSAQSKVSQSGEFNQKYLSNYLSALISANSNETKSALKYYNLSKNLIFKHENYLKNYVSSLIQNGDVNKAIKVINKYSRNKSAEFYEARIILIADAIANKDFKKANFHANELSKLSKSNGFELIITEVIESYINLFLRKKIYKSENNYGRLSLVTDAFQACYLGRNKSNKYFLNLVNSDQGDYSRYLFFYLGNLINEGDFVSVNQIASTINYIDTNLLVGQSKRWIENKEFEKFGSYFSCNNEKDILGEFFYLVANLYSSQEDFVKSNFYFQISNFLNKKFYFNNTLLAENYFLNKNYNKSFKILNDLNKKDQIYHWYKIKKTAQIISIQKSEKNALNYIENNVKKLDKLDYKILYDLANIYKNFKNYEKSIEFYSLVLNKIEKNSPAYADSLYRRGSSYERIGDYEKSDKDLVESLSIIGDDPYVLNYLAYSWLERDHKVNAAIKMLQTAYEKKNDDPYIVDSLGWAYYKYGDYIKAEKYLNYAVQLRPNDPVIMDHYGDVLWKLNKKLQARYFWKNAVKINDSDEIDKDDVKKKILTGPNKI